MKCGNCGTDNSEDRLFCGECGERLSPPLNSKQDESRSEEQPYKLRVNLLCLFGATLAVVSLFLPWAVTQDHLGDETAIGAFDFDDPLPGGGEFPEAFRYSITLFIIGTVLSFLTPLGGIPLMAGAVGFALTSLTSRIADHDVIPWLGVLIALLSAVAVVLSFVEPIGTGYKSEQEPELSAKLLTWSAYR